MDPLCSISLSLCAGVEVWVWSWRVPASVCSLHQSWSSTTRRATSCIMWSSPAAPCCASSACCCCLSPGASRCRRAWLTERPSPVRPCFILESSIFFLPRLTGTTLVSTTHHYTSQPPGEQQWQQPPLWQRYLPRTPWRLVGRWLATVP